MLALKKKTERIGTPLKDWDVRICFGIKTGFNEAFIIDNETKERLCKEDPKNIEVLKPILRGRDIQRYSYEWAGLWLIKIESGWTDRHRGKKAPERFYNETYPAIYRYLKDIGDKVERGEIKAKGKGLYHRDDQGDFWWELRDCDYYGEFEKEKIVFSRIVKSPQFAYDNNRMYAEATTYVLTGEYIKYLAAILNSPFVYWVFYKFYSGGGIDGEIKIYKLEQLPIPKISESEQEPFIEIVDKILAITKDEDYLSNPTKQAKVKEHEAEIDRLVYNFYGLTEEEIKVVEESREKRQ